MKHTTLHNNINIPELRKKTVTVTFRLDKDLITILRSESERQHISLNTMVNLIIQRFVEWDMYESKLGMVSFLRPVVVELLKQMTGQEVIALARGIGKRATNDAALFMKNKMDLDSFLSWLEVGMRNSSVEIKHNIDENTQTYILKHELGLNYSLFYKTILESIFNEILGKHIDCSYSDRILSFSFNLV
ncbi:MAG: hypothetical protein WA364_23515 [Candidatus Nitrosopolaris sp.]